MIWILPILAVVLFVLGSWGRGAAAELVPPFLSEAERSKRERVYRRGAVTLQLVAVLFFAVALAAVVGVITGPH